MKKIFIPLLILLVFSTVSAQQKEVVKDYNYFKNLSFDELMKESDNPIAQGMIGFLYAIGEAPGGADCEKAKEWRTKSAQHMNATALFSLAANYELDDSVRYQPYHTCFRQNLPLAYALYSLSYEVAVSENKPRLDIGLNRILELSKKMSAADIEKANVLAKEWKEKFAK